MGVALVVVTAVLLSTILAGIAGHRAFLATVSPLRESLMPRLRAQDSPLPPAWLVAEGNRADDVRPLPRPEEVRCAGLIAASFAGLVVFSATSFATALGYVAFLAP